MAPPTNVWVDGTWYGPSYPAAGDPPEGSYTVVADDGDDEEQYDAGGLLVGATTAVNDGPAEAVVGPPSTESAVLSDVDAPPAQAGPGSSRAKWADYASAHGVAVADDDTREAIIAACRDKGVRVD